MNDTKTTPAAGPDAPLNSAGTNPAPETPETPETPEAPDPARNDSAANSNDQDSLLNFKTVLEAERKAIKYEKGKAIGLALSGGGIRSATFNLGVIQALAEQNLLRKFDYLSTISGGGYIGSWLSLFIKRYGNGKVADIESELCKREGNLEHSAIRFLRSYSNYLTPRVGLSRDTLIAAVTYLRNLLLNLIILLTLTAAALIIPRIAALLLETLVSRDGLSTYYNAIMVALLVPPASIVALGLLYRQDNVNPSPRRDEKKTDRTKDETGRRDEKKKGRRWFMRIRWLIMLLDTPLVMAGFLATCFYVQASFAQPGTCSRFLPTTSIYFLLWAAGFGVARVYLSREKQRVSLITDSRGTMRWWAAFLSFSLLAGVAGAAFMTTIAKTIQALPAEHRCCVALTFGPPATILAFSSMLTVHVGLMGRKFAEQDRELWSVYGARLLACAAMWTAIFTIAIYAPPLLKWLDRWVIAMGGFAWVASTLFGVLAGKSEKTGRRSSRRRLETLTSLAPSVFVLGLLFALSWGLHWTLNKGHDSYFGTPEVNSALDETRRATSGFFYLRANPKAGMPVVTARDIETPNPWDELLTITEREYQGIKQWGPHWWVLVILTAAALILALLASWRVNINLFSLHHFYCNRLIRCYLGATRKDRRPHPLTGFDPADDVMMSELAGQRPLHIVGTAINLNSGRQLAWQNRRAASFAFTPLHVGYELACRHTRSGFRPAAQYGKDSNNLPVRLGTAIAISGAAASPNMGFHTSPTVAFLLTVFNVRLGQWCGDPVHSKAWRYRDPLLSLRYWLAELTGSADVNYPFVNLSDGGHFENLGIYELVRRRCAVILACDAGADLNYTFDDLAETMRKCYTDFGITFRFKPKVDDIRPQPQDWVPTEEWVGKRHYAIAEITYPDTSYQGTLIYLKSSLSANLPPDITNYRRTHKDFPHETTADQFFDESQFESYRHLGYEVAKRSLKAMLEENELPQALR